MATLVYNDFDFNNGSTTWVDESSRPYNAAPRRDLVTPYATRHGGVVLPIPPGLRELMFGGVVQHASDWTVTRAAMLTALSVTGRDLEFDGLTAPAAPHDITFEPISATAARYQVAFTLLDALQAAVPTTTEQTLPYALVSGTTYRSRFTVAAAGSAPAPIRWHIVNPAGSPTPTSWRLANLTTIPAEYLTITGSVAASNMLTVDPQYGHVYATPLTNVQGYWPLESNADYSGNNRGLSPANSPVSVVGRLGLAYSFNGTNQKYTNSAAGLGLTGSFSICGWVKPAVTLAANAGFFGKASSNAGYFIGATSINWRFQKGTGASAQTLSVRHDGGGTNPSTFRGTAGQWTFICGTYSSGNGMRLYLGDPNTPPILEGVAPTATAAPTAGTNDFAVGGVFDTGGVEQFFNGTIDEVAVLSLELTSAQVRDIWQYGVPAFSRTNLSRTGAYPWLHPEHGATNALDLQLEAASAPGTMIGLLRYASRYD